MQKGLDTIKFESRYELHELIKMIEKYMEDHPKEAENKTIKQFYNYLDAIAMYW